MESSQPEYEFQVNLDDPNQSLTQMVLLSGVGRRILEVGPATGYVTKVLAERGNQVTAIEVDPEMAKSAAKHAERIIVADIETLDFDEEFEPASFDIILLGDVLEHLRDPPATLRRLITLLAPDGAVVASIPNVAHAAVRLSLLAGRFVYTPSGLLDATHVRFFTRESIYRLFEAAGLLIGEEKRIELGPFGTEIELDPEAYPTEVLQLLEADPEARVYQYVVKAYRDVPESPARVLEQRLREAEERTDRLAADLGREQARRLMPPVDVVVVAFNSARFLPGFLASVDALAYPHELLRLIVVDNASADGSSDIVGRSELAKQLDVEMVLNGRNLGFASGVNQGLARSAADFVFVVNPDTLLSEEMIERLVGRMVADPTIGIAEARQSPREHPKAYDDETGETAWCSLAGAMLRRRAVDRVGMLDERFYLYCEDVDLSWRMWLGGFRCVYMPDAVFEHFTEELDPQRDRSRQYYFGLRNGLFMRFIYGSRADYLSFWRAVRAEARTNPDPAKRKLARRARLVQPRFIPHLIRRRLEIRGRRHPHVRFVGNDYAETRRQ